jgi:Leucine-rich repeat (LRR) protein
MVAIDKVIMNLGLCDLVKQQIRDHQLDDIFSRLPSLDVATAKDLAERDIDIKTHEEKLLRIFLKIFNATNEEMQQLPTVVSKPAPLEERDSLSSYLERRELIKEERFFLDANDIAQKQGFEDLKDLLNQIESWPRSEQACAVKQWLDDKNLLIFATELAKSFQSLKELLNSNKSLPLDKQARQIREWFNEGGITLTINNLNLNYLELTQIPKELKFFGEVQVLHLSGNDIRHIPDGVFDNLTNLKQLFLRDNPPKNTS